MIPHYDKPLAVQIRFRLFQAAMWRHYAFTFARIRPSRAYVTRALGDPWRPSPDARWLLEIGHVTSKRCRKQALVNLKLARRLRQRLNRQKG